MEMLHKRQRELKEGGAPCVCPYEEPLFVQAFHQGEVETVEEWLRLKAQGPAQKRKKGKNSYSQSHARKPVPAPEPPQLCPICRGRQFVVNCHLLQEEEEKETVGEALLSPWQEESCLVIDWDTDEEQLNPEINLRNWNSDPGVLFTSTF
ncbi:UNVERIFIED_CONTAM: hypothetical protein FKN15_001775 [Acipenser sinensis]